MKLTPARRVPVVDGLDPLAACTQAGDYYGPVMGYSGDRPSVFFLLPIARDNDAPPGARSLHHVESPPHVFRECDDGSLEIRESIGAGDRTPGYYWHGYLDAGNVWREL